MNKLDFLVGSGFRKVGDHYFSKRLDVKEFLKKYVDYFLDSNRMLYDIDDNNPFVSTFMIGDFVYITEDEFTDLPYDELKSVIRFDMRDFIDCFMLDIRDYKMNKLGI